MKRDQSNQEARKAGKAEPEKSQRTVDVANLPGVTIDESIEKKIDSLRFAASRIRRGECELARKKCAEYEAESPGWRY